VYDFWNDRYVGRIAGSSRLRQTLRPGEARMLSFHAAVDHPQVVSTNRHILQGALDLIGEPVWDAARHALRGRSRVVAGEPYRLVIAANGHPLRSASCDRGAAALRAAPGRTDLFECTIRPERSGIVAWTVSGTK
jgi:hypothetical protein